MARPFKFKLPTTSKESARHRQIQKSHSEFEIPRYHMIPTDKHSRWHGWQLTFHFVTNLIPSGFVVATHRRWYIGTSVAFFPFTISHDSRCFKFGVRRKVRLDSGLKLKKWTAAIWPRLGFICWKMVVFKVWCPATPPPSHAPRNLSKILLEALRSAWISRCPWPDFHMEGRWSSSNPGVWTIWKLQKR